MSRITHLSLLGIAVLAAASSSCDRIRTLVKSNMQPSQPAVLGTYSSDQISQLDPASFESFIARKNRLVIIDFYADSCPPCRQLSPVLEQAAKTIPELSMSGKSTSNRRESWRWLKV
ncbi:MAG: thioredoxin [Akkermansiaceae bacterium]|nr:thioredoxin [Akkermansiaceae bacterium]